MRWGDQGLTRWHNDGVTSGPAATWGIVCAKEPAAPASTPSQPPATHTHALLLALLECYFVDL